MSIKFGKGNGHSQEGHHLVEASLDLENKRRALQEAWKDIVPHGEADDQYVVRIIYWKNARWMTEVMMDRVPGPEDIERDYVVMWEGIMRLKPRPDVTGSLEQIFMTFQDNGTYPYFSQREVKQKLQPHPHTSMSMGDIVEIDTVKYVCAVRGWRPL